MILEKLDTINWHELSHAYGAADDVPQIIRAMTSRKENRRESAYSRFYSTLYHQGTVYQASASVVPFLIELLTNEHVPARHDIIASLVSLAECHIHRHDYTSVYHEQRRRKPWYQEQYQKNLYWAEMTYQAVRKGIDTYLMLLTHKKPRIRMSTINILGLFKEERSKLIPVLSARLQVEPNHLVRSCIIFSLGQLAEYGSYDYKKLLHLLSNGETELMRISAAMALVHMGKEDTPPQALNLLLRAVKQHRMWENVYSKLPWPKYRFAFDAVKTLTHLPSQMNDAAIPQILQLLAFFDEQRAFDNLNDDIALEIAKLLLHLAFRKEKVEEESSSEDLKSEQQLVLQAIASTDAIWSWSNGSLGHGSYYDYERKNGLVEVCMQTNFYELLLLGLPNERKALREFVHMAPSEEDQIRYLKPANDMSAKMQFKIIKMLNPHLSTDTLEYIRSKNWL